MSIKRKYFFKKSTQILIPNQLRSDKFFAFFDCNLLIIIILALELGRSFNSNYSFVFSDVFHISTPLFQ